MASIYFFWNDIYLKEMVGLVGKSICLNVCYHIFTPDELRSLRAYEVNLCPETKNEQVLAQNLRKALNRYGVVQITKKPKDSTHE